MALNIPPDTVFELFMPSQPSTDETNELVSLVQSNLPVQISEHLWFPDISVLSIGCWIAKDGFTDDQLQGSLRVASFISGDPGATADLFFSTALIKLIAALNWASPNVSKKIGAPIGDVTLDDKINVDVSSAGIVTTITGSYNPKVLPSISFTYTITDSFRLDQSGNLKPNTSTNLNVSALGIIEEAVLVGLLNQFLGGVAFFGGILGGGAADPHEAGVGAQLAANWPDNNRGILTSKSPPLTGKVIFTWSKLNVDTSGLSTLGVWNLTLRSPQVQIVGPAVLKFTERAGSATGSYTLKVNSDLNGVATVVWGGDATGTDSHTTVNFGAPGDYSIQVSVTDDDNVTATAAMNVTVKETKNGGHPA